MAVAFTPPDDGSNGSPSAATGATATAAAATATNSGSPSSSSTPINTNTPSTSNMSSPQQSPNNFHDRGEQLLQAIYNAIYHYGGSPNFPLPPPPPSPSCSSPHPYHNNNNNSNTYNNNNTNSGGFFGDAFFPRSQPTPRTPRTPINHNNSGGRNHFEYPRRQRLSSTGSENDYEENSCYDPASDLDSSNEDFDEHFTYMAARERLQEFPGRVPPRRKKKEQTFVWPTAVVTAVVLAVGCGILVTRN